MTNKNNTYNNIRDSILIKENLNYSSETRDKLKFRFDCLFSRAFIKNLKHIIGDSQVFIKKNTVEKQEIYNKLQEACNIEHQWKDISSRIRFNQSKVKQLYQSEYDVFIETYKKNFINSSTDKRISKRYGSEKCIVFWKGLVKHLSQSQYLKTMFELTPDFDKKIKDSDYQLLVKRIDPGVLFRELVKISMKVAYDTNISIENTNRTKFHTQSVGENFMQAKRTDLQYNMQEFISIYLTIHLFDLFAEKNILQSKSTKYREKIFKYLDKYYKSKIRTRLDDPKYSFYFETSTITIILLALYDNTDVVKDIVQVSSVKKGKVRQHKVYIFDHRLDNSISFSKHVPKIVPPKKADTEQHIRNWIRPVKSGWFTCQISKKCIRALNIAQRKTFKTNKLYWDILNSINENEPFCDQFPTEKQFLEKTFETEAWQRSAWSSLLDTALYTTTDRFIKANSKYKKVKNYHNTIVGLCDITHASCYSNCRKNEVQSEMLIIRNKKQIFNTSLTITKIFENFPLYYDTLLDFRFRMYPLQYLMSRTSGYLKYLLQEYKPRKVTKKGLNFMLEAYYSPEPEQLAAFQSATCKHSFFKDNELKEPTLYFRLLRKEIESLLNGDKLTTSLPLEIDQVGSGPTLIALICGNLPLAKKCNLLEGPFNCIYSYLLQRSVEYLQNKMKNKVSSKNQKSYDILTTDRKSQKYALMCFFYNEQHLSRTKRWVSRFEEIHGTTIDDDNYKLLEAFSIKYGEFLNFVFPKLNDQLSLMNEALMVLIQKDRPVQIKTLDGCLVKWDFDYVTSLKKNYYNPVSKKHDQYRTNVQIKNKVSQLNRTQKHVQSFRPNFVHSIDASIMREFITKFYDRTGHKLNHLHDCVMLHPNDVDIFYEVVSDVYCNPRMHTLAQDLLFSRFKIDTIDECRKTIADIEEKFVKNMDEIKLTRNTFSPKKCYRYEGAK